MQRPRRARRRQRRRRRCWAQGGRGGRRRRRGRSRAPTAGVAGGEGHGGVEAADDGIGPAVDVGGGVAEHEGRVVAEAQEELLACVRARVPARCVRVCAGAYSVCVCMFVRARARVRACVRASAPQANAIRRLEPTDPHFGRAGPARAGKTAPHAAGRELGRRIADAAVQTADASAEAGVPLLVA